MEEGNLQFYQFRNKNIRSYDSDTILFFLMKGKNIKEVLFPPIKIIYTKFCISFIHTRILKISFNVSYLSKDY